MDQLLATPLEFPTQMPSRFARLETEPVFDPTISAVMAAFGGLPALIMSRYLGLKSGLYRIATKAGM